LAVALGFDMANNPKMNWERVHKEDLARKHGSEWAGQEQSVSSKAGKKSRTKPRPHGTIINGCTCRKHVGFVGEHQRSCPLRGSAATPKALTTPKVLTSPNAVASPKTTLFELEAPLSIAEFASIVRRVGHDKQLRSFFNRELELLKKYPNVSPRQRDEATTAIHVLLHGL
jgi:hypothetical protein